MTGGTSLRCAASVTERIDAPIGAVWDVIADFSSLPRKLPDVRDFVLEGSGVGTVRRFRVGDGPVMQERIETWEPAEFRFAYSLLPPAFMDSYLSDVRLEPDGSDACIVHWSGACQVSSEAEAEQRREFISGVYRNGIAWVRKELGLR